MIKKRINPNTIEETNAKNKRKRAAYSALPSYLGNLYLNKPKTPIIIKNTANNKSINYNKISYYIKKLKINITKKSHTKSAGL